MPPSPPPTTNTQTCPFCAIALANPPSTSLLSPTSACQPSPSSSDSSPSNTPPFPSPPAHLILSTPHLLAFLDHAPISRGHVLLVVRAHREKLSDVLVREGESVGRWLGVVSRAVMGAVREDDGKGDGKGKGWGQGDGDGDRDVGDWNVVQNNGARAAQVVPHVHFHIIPRVGDVPEVKARSWTVFGKGQREELDEDDAVVLVRRMREGVRREVERVRGREGEEGVGRLLGDCGVGRGRGRGSKL